jgi:hypothetical protein
VRPSERIFIRAEIKCSVEAMVRGPAPASPKHSEGWARERAKNEPLGKPHNLPSSGLTYLQENTGIDNVIKSRPDFRFQDFLPVRQPYSGPFKL